MFSSQFCHAPERPWTKTTGLPSPISTYLTRAPTTSTSLRCSRQSLRIGVAVRVGAVGGRRRRELYPAGRQAHREGGVRGDPAELVADGSLRGLSLIHISEP